jgi:hypothetical protein
MSLLDLSSKVIGVLAAILGLAGYVLVLGAAVLWLRLHQAHLPTDSPVALASREELLTIGAQAVAVWLVLAGALAGLAAWIVLGDPETRRFGYVEGGLALCIAASTLLALGTNPWLAALPAAALLTAAAAALLYWPSRDAVAALVVPALIAAAVGVSLSFISNGNRIAMTVGVALIFGVLVIFTPHLQKWRALHEPNQDAIARLPGEEGEDPNLDLIRKALKRGGRRPRPPLIAKVERAALVALGLVVLGTISVASQVDSDRDFHEARVLMNDGGCLVGSYVTRGNDEILLAEPDPNNEDSEARIAAVPAAETEEVQVYGKALSGPGLQRLDPCQASRGDVLESSERSPKDDGTTDR